MNFLDSEKYKKLNYSLLLEPEKILIPGLFYTYRLTFVNPQTKQIFYYMGYHQANNKKDPREDCYYSSSKTVKNLLKEHGISCFKKKIIGLYLTRSEAINKEIEYHARLKVDSNIFFLNLARQTDTKFFYDNAGRVQTGESNKKRSASLIGVNKMTQKGRDSVSEYQSNIRIRSEQERENLRQNAIKRNQLLTTCPYCKKVGQRPAMFRWHFDNCKYKL